MKKYICLFIIILLTTIVSAQDVKLIIPKTSIENSIKTLLDARAASFSSYTPSFGLDMWNVKLIYSTSHPLTVTLLPPNRFRITCGVVGRGNIDWLAGNFSVNGEGDATIEGQIQCQGNQGQIQLNGSADAVISFSGGLPGFIINMIGLGQFAINIPQFKLASYVYTLPYIPLNYFTTNYPTINIENDNIILGLQTPSNFLVVDQKDHNGNRLQGSVVSHWENNNFVDYAVPKIFSNLPLNSSQTFRGYQNIISNDKFYIWSTNEINNFKTFNLNGSISRLNSNFQPTTSGVSIKNNIENSNLQSGVVQFQDPWLVDYEDHNFPNPQGGYFKRNQSTSAPFKERNSPFTPDIYTNYNGDVYSGIFLSQGGMGFANPHYSVLSPTPYVANLGTTMGSHKLYFLNWSASNDITLQNSLSNQTGVIFNSSSGILTANLKGSQLSNNSSAFSSNSQRKVLSTYSTYNECLFHVYESMGSLWLEKSTDRGTSWSLFPSSSPLINSPASAPSITHVNLSESSQDYIFITYLSGNAIKGCAITSASATNRADYTISSESNSPGNPVAAYIGGNRVFVLWKGTDGFGQSGFVYNIGTYPSINPLNITWYFETEQLLTNTTANSINPTIESLNNDNHLRLAWEENSTIKYYDITVNSNNTISIPYSQTISNYSGFSTNSKPSIVAVNGGSRLTWIGRRTGYMGIVEQKAVFMDPSNINMVWSFGSNVQNTTINSSADCYSIAWSTSNTASLQFTDSHTLSTISTLTNLTGNDVQLSNGNRDYMMRAFSFNNASAPYYFNNKNLYTQAKQNSVLNAINNGREGIVRKDNCQFYFALGDVVADNKISEFTPVTDSTRLQSLDDLNNYLVTNSIQVNDNSQLAYSVEYGISDSTSALNALKGNNQINFKVEILDAVTNEVLGTSDNVTYDSLHAFNYDNISYQVNMAGIGNKTIKLRLKVSSNSDVEYSLKSSYATDNVILKRQVKNNVVTLHTKVNSYDLSQNYPNPFNPSTTIKYQIPKAGQVTIKVYDILGNEVANLVNEFKNEGRYNVNFDASKLASGVYIYQIKSNEYISSKKMMLLK